MREIRLIPERLAEVVEEARRWVGTPYRHKGRRRGVACDCIGLPYCIARDLGLDPGPDLDWYSPVPHAGRVEREAHERMGLVASGPGVNPGSHPAGLIGLFWAARRGLPQHFGVLARHPLAPEEVTVIHALQRNRKVVEARLSGPWSRRLVSLHALPGTYEVRP